MLLTLFPVAALANDDISAITETSTVGVPRADFSGRLGEWAHTDVAYSSVSDGGLTLRASTDGNTLFTIVEGASRDTRNVYYISIAGETGGHARLGRPNVHFLVANGWLYRATADQATNTTPEWFGNTATRLSRINMEYHGTWTGMVLRLDQFGIEDLNPADISISWQGFSAAVRSTTPAHLPADGTSLMPVTASFLREQVDGVYYPTEDFNIILNPLVGGGASMVSGGAATGQTIGYAYVSWRSLQPNRDELDLSQARIYNWNDYPVLGPNRDQWGSRAPLLSALMAAYASRGQYVQLRMIMDLPTGNRTNSGITGLNWYNPTAADFPDGGFNALSAAQRNSAINLRNRTIADIPDWAVATMRRESNRPNDACVRNIPFEPDRRHLVWDAAANDGAGTYVDDGLFDRMRDPNDSHALFWQGFRDQAFVHYANAIYYDGVRVTDGLFRCAIPNPAGGADLRVCPDGCVPYRRPLGVRADVSGTCPDGTGALQRHAGWDPNNNWGPEGMWYYSWPAISGAVGLAPRYDHHLLLDYHEQLVNLLAEEIARPGSDWNAVVQVQLGTLGHWGEWHNWPTANAGTFPNAEVAYPFVRHYIDAFACNPNVHIGMRYANWIGARYGTGYFHDEAGQTSHFSQMNTISQQNLSVDNFTPTGWGFGTAAQTGVAQPPPVTDSYFFGIHYNRNANMANVPAVTGIPGTAAAFNNAVSDPTFWMRRWSGGEYGDTSASVANPGNWNGIPRSTVTCDIPRDDLIPGWGQPGFNSIMRTIYSFRWNHTSNLAPRGPLAGRPRPGNATDQRVHKNNDAMFDNMGYRFVVEEVSVDGDLSRGETVDVSMVVNNRGVAPFHRSWPFEVSFINEDGQVADRVIIDEVDIVDWLPRHRAFNNARPAMTAYRYVTSHITGEQVRVYYRPGAEQAVQGTLFIPAFDGRNLVEFELEIPYNLPDGAHTLAITILDPILGGKEPGIRFHNTATRADGRLVFEPFVVAAEPTGISFTLPAVIRRNQSVTPELTVLPAGALQDATWTSSNPALASVNRDTGAVTARAASGIVVITATTLCGTFRHSVTVRLSA